MARNCDRSDATSVGDRPADRSRSKPCGGGCTLVGPTEPLAEEASAFASPSSSPSSIFSRWGSERSAVVAAVAASASSSAGDSWVAAGETEQWM